MGAAPSSKITARLRRALTVAEHSVRRFSRLMRSPLQHATKVMPGAHNPVARSSRLAWASHRVLSWRLSITMEAAFCVATLEDTLARYGKPDIPIRVHGPGPRRGCSPTTTSRSACKFACNNDPLRGDFRVQFRPLLTCCVSVLPFGPAGPGRALGDDWRGQDRRDTTRLF